MQVALLIPLLYHAFLNYKDKKRLLIEGILSLGLFMLAWYFESRYVNGVLLLLFLYNEHRRDYFLYIACVILFACTITLSYYLIVWVLLEMVFVLYSRFMNKSYEQEMQEYQNKVFDRQVEEVENMYSTMRGWRHDYHNHLQNLKAKLQQEEITASIQYLAELEQELNDIKQLVESGNTNMDAILNSKLSLAINNHIDINVKASVPQQLPISDTDICALLGNLIDNALEACDKMIEGKFIRFYIGQYKGQLYISCTNATSEVERKIDTQYITSKRGNHGHGLKRMNKIIEKYEGSIVRKNEPGVFITEILLPM